MPVHDTDLPISHAAVTGVWINDTVVTFGDGYIMRPITRLTLSANGEAALDGDSVTEHKRRPLTPRPVKVTPKLGTWTLQNEKVILNLPSRSVPRDELSLVRRQASDGLTRIVLRTSHGAVFWRPEAT